MSWPLQDTKDEIERLRAINTASKADVQYYETKNAELRKQIAKLRQHIKDYGVSHDAIEIENVKLRTALEWYAKGRDGYVARAALEETK